MAVCSFVMEHSVAKLVILAVVPLATLGVALTISKRNSLTLHWRFPCSHEDYVRLSDRLLPPCYLCWQFAFYTVRYKGSHGKILWLA